MTLRTLKMLLKRVWSRETSADPKNWSDENPAWGQCAVTALIVQDNFGGDILCCFAYPPEARYTAHYYNRLPNGTIVDLTRQQFPKKTRFDSPESRARFSITAYFEIEQRYRLLKRQLQQLEKKH